MEQYNIRLCMFVGIAAGLLLKHSGLTQRQVAQQLNVKSGSTVSKQIVRSREIIKTNGELSSQNDKCDEILREIKRVEQLLND